MNKTPIYNHKQITPMKLFLISLIAKHIEIELGENEDSESYQVMARVNIHSVFNKRSKAILYKSGKPVVADNYELLKNTIDRLCKGVSVTYKPLINQKLNPLGEIIGYLDTSQNFIQINLKKS